MLRLVILAVAVSVVTSLPAKLPNPAELALYLNEEEFEDYLDKWLAVQQKSWVNNTARDARSGCTLNVNGDFGQPQPVFLRQNTNSYLLPTGNSGQVTLNSGEQVTVACTGSGRTIQHPNILTSVATATAQCVNSNLVSGSGWLNGNREFGLLTCSSHAYHEAQETNERCFNNNVVIQVGFTVNNVFYPLYRSCFDKNRFEVLYVWYEQNPSYAVHQTGVDRPSWLAGSFFPGVTINSLYTQVQQKQAIARAVGDTLADQYVTSTQFLARGHLIAKSDQIFATGQRATFYFINAVPQWQPFNAGNWNSLEQALRSRIGVAGYDCVIYTGAFGVTQLRDSNGRFVDIYLDNTDNNERLPVPLYMYKVAYDESRRLGTAFISINNPHYTAAEARALQFCTDRCRNNAAFNWLSWQPDRVDIGYSFCCTIDDFTRRISHLPSMTVNGLLS